MMVSLFLLLHQREHSLVRSIMGGLPRTKESLNGATKRHIFLLVRVTGITNFKVPRILIEKGIFCDIMYAEPFERLVLK